MTDIAATHPPLETIAADPLDVATQWQLMWWRFRRHGLAMTSLVVVVVLSLVAALSGFLAYADHNESEAFRALLPPTPIHFFDETGWNPFVYAVERTRDPATFKIKISTTDKKVPVRFFAKGSSYNVLGLIPADIHLFGTDDGDAGAHIFLFGTDEQGRDMWSRLMVATSVSLTIGLVGVTLSLVVGVTLGGLSGLFGGPVDAVIQRVIEIVRSIPVIPLWMGLAAAMPRDWSVLQVYFALTIIISLIGWTDLARVVRGRFMALREEDFIVAAELIGASRLRIIFRHMVPSFLSHIIAAVTLAIPVMIVSETALSFLGLGLRPPAISWGVLLQQAQNLQSIALSPWQLIPVLPVIVAILAFNFLGDGLRDAADPYGY
jgi:peptide/nickel transport system permease protein